MLTITIEKTILFTTGPVERHMDLWYLSYVNTLRFVGHDSQSGVCNQVRTREKVVFQITVRS
jgi:hypothetical protein